MSGPSKYTDVQWTSIANHSVQSKWYAQGQHTALPEFQSKAKPSLECTVDCKDNSPQDNLPFSAHALYRDSPNTDCELAHIIHFVQWDASKNDADKSLINACAWNPEATLLDEGPHGERGQVTAVEPRLWLTLEITTTIWMSLGKTSNKTEKFPTPLKGKQWSLEAQKEYTG